MRASNFGTRRAALRNLCGFVSLAVLAPVHAAAAAEHEPLQPIDDLRALSAEVRRMRKPLLLFFSTPGCPYCLEVRRSYLAPRVREDATAGVIIREIDITSRRAIAGIDGKPLTESDLARSYSVRMVPVVLLVDADLVALADPLIGLDRSGYYEAYLQAAIDAARSKVKIGR
jgi:thioredoxin-related protein